MKSQAKVKQQRRIKNIPNYCDNPDGRIARTNLDLMKKGIIEMASNRHSRKGIKKQVSRIMQRSEA